MPVFGTCAGLILLAKEVENDQTYLGTMNIEVKRNAYGRQLVTAFHPEVTNDVRVHQYFLDMID